MFEHFLCIRYVVGIGLRSNTQSVCEYMFSVNERLLQLRKEYPDSDVLHVRNSKHRRGSYHGVVKLSCCLCLTDLEIEKYTVRACSMYSV